jgi:hypothetical protein
MGYFWGIKSIKFRTEYFKQPLNPTQHDKGQKEITRIRRGVKITNEDAGEPPTKEELEQAVKVLKNNKVPGLDEKPSKLWRIGGADLIAILFHLITEAWNTEQMPRE